MKSGIFLSLISIILSVANSLADRIPQKNRDDRVTITGKVINLKNQPVVGAVLYTE